MLAGGRRFRLACVLGSCVAAVCGEGRSARLLLFASVRNIHVTSLSLIDSFAASYRGLTSNSPLTMPMTTVSVKFTDMIGQFCGREDFSEWLKKFELVLTLQEGASALSEWGGL